MIAPYSLLKKAQFSSSLIHLMEHRRPVKNHKKTLGKKIENIVKNIVE